MLTVFVFVATPLINRRLLRNFEQHPSGLLLIVAAVLALLAGPHFRHRRRHTATFLASAALIVLVVGVGAFALFPDLLPATPNPSSSLTVFNASASDHGLTVALVWFGVGACLVALYTASTYYLFRGKVHPETDAY